MGLISFGKISKAHGLAGEVKFLPFSGQLDNISTLERIIIYMTPGGPPLELKILKRSFQKGSAILKLEGVDSIDDAQMLIGNHVYVEASDLRTLEDDEFYWFDLIGLETFTDDGQYIGIVDSLIDRSLQSLLVVKNNDKEYLIPLTEPIVKNIDLEQSKIIISPITGLLD
ncbi:MAG: 16S rRNA processing protein RimM [Deltaproteobacteria bacterium]|nr:16S rRNA processing protein RimM [Deltaproteobacteria bacterium]MCK5710101.1 16S rRNA processing protein RimM [Deltaproteobacteria bacterium]